MEMAIRKEMVMAMAMVPVVRQHQELFCPLHVRVSPVLLQCVQASASQHQPISTLSSTNSHSYAIAAHLPNQRVVGDGDGDGAVPDLTKIAHDVHVPQMHPLMQQLLHSLQPLAISHS